MNIRLEIMQRLCKNFFSKLEIFKLQIQPFFCRQRFFSITLNLQIVITRPRPLDCSNAFCLREDLNSRQGMVRTFCKLNLSPRSLFALKFHPDKNTLTVTNV